MRRGKSKTQKKVNQQKFSDMSEEKQDVMAEIALMRLLGDPNIKDEQLEYLFKKPSIVKLQPDIKEQCFMKSIMDVLHKLKIFSWLSDDPEFYSEIKKTISSSGPEDPKRFMAYLLKCVREEKWKSATDTIRQLYKQEEESPFAVFDRLRTKMHRPNKEFQIMCEDSEDVDLGLDYIGAWISLSLIEMCSKAPGLKGKLQKTAPVYGDSSWVNPLFLWPTVLGHSLLCLNSTIDQYVNVGVVYEKHKLISVLFTGTVKKLMELTFADVRKEMKGKILFEFKLWDSYSGSIIEDESRCLSQIVGKRALRALPITDLSYNKDKWMSDLHVDKVSAYFAGDKHLAKESPLFVLEELTDLQLYGWLPDLNPSILHIRQRGGDMLLECLTSTFSTGPLTYVLAANFMHIAIYEKAPAVNSD